MLYQRSRLTNVSAANWEVGTSTVFFFFQGCSFLIACYILYPGPHLENKGKHEMYKKITFHTRREPFLYYGYF